MPLYNPPKIGQTIRVLDKSRHARHYIKYEVISETSRSWVVKQAGYCEWITQIVYESNPQRYDYAVKKLPKIGQKRGDWELGTQEDADLADWVLENARAIARQVEYLQDPRKLHEVANLIGYKTPEKV